LLCAQIVLLGLAIWALTSPTWRISSVRVEGSSDPVVLNAIARMPLTGCIFFLCDLDARARQVQTIPAVAHAQVHAVYPNGLIVAITLRQPALLWRTTVQTLVISDDGVILGTPQSDPAYANLHVPQVRDDDADAFGGHISRAGQRLALPLVKMAAELQEGLPAALGNGWTLVYTAPDGFAATSGDGRRVVFGAPRDAASAATPNAGVTALLGDPALSAITRGVSIQLAELHALLAQLTAQGQRATLIDLRWGAYPYYRLAG
ncbi:MAG TPA: hypothetical protein VJR48_05085, partial [Ktedonobacterales bacterium]|nr:hypothetical protein [Ktedonobacterales bacterium]